MKKVLIFIFVFVSFNPLGVFAQPGEEIEKIEKSGIIETIDGTSFYVHFVKRGETLKSLLDAYNVDFEELKNYNRGLSEDLTPNVILKIPVKKSKPNVDSYNNRETVSSDDILEVHMVKRKETLYSISRLYGVSIEELSKVNDLSKGLQAGVELIIPKKPKPKVNPSQASKPDKQQSRVVEPLDKTNTSDVFVNKNVSEAEKAAPKVSDSGNPKAVESIIRDLVTVETTADQAVENVETPVVSEPVLAENQYKVKHQETLYSLSKRFNTTIDELLRLNPELKQGLKEEQIITVPQKKNQYSVSVNQSPSLDKDTMHLIINHKVLRRETFYSISKKYNIMMGDIYKLNPGIQLKGLKKGNYVKVPVVMDLYSGEYIFEFNGVKKDTVIYYVKHQVQKKQKLSDIAKMYSVDEDRLRLLNPKVKKKASKNSIVLIPVEKKKVIKVVESLPPETVEVVTEPVKEKEDDNVNYYCKNNEPHRVWKVALLLPLSLETVDLQDIENSMKYNANKIKAFNFIHFYEGALLALNTMEQMGLNVELFVYDVDKNPNKAIKLLNTNLQNMDLIIGPFYHNTFSIVNQYAQRFDIPIVNPLTKRSEVVKNNKNVFKVQSSVSAHLEALAENIVSNVKDSSNIVILRHNMLQNVDRANFLTSKIEEFTAQKGIYVQPSVYINDSIAGLLNKTSPFHENIVINVSDDEVFVMDAMRQMHEYCDSIPFTLYGMPSWTKFNLETNYLLDLNVHLFENNYIDYDDPDVDRFVNMFYETYGVAPDTKKYAFTGFDVTYYFLNAIRQFGRDFSSCIEGYKFNGLEYVFDFKKMPSGSFENQGGIGYRFENYRLIRIK